MFQSRMSSVGHITLAFCPDPKICPHMPDAPALRCYAINVRSKRHIFRRQRPSTHSRRLELSSSLQSVTMIIKLWGFLGRSIAPELMQVVTKMVKNETNHPTMEDR